jgi:hypothetical protein
MTGTDADARLLTKKSQQHDDAVRSDLALENAFKTLKRPRIDPDAIACTKLRTRKPVKPSEGIGSLAERLDDAAGHRGVLKAEPDHICHTHRRAHRRKHLRPTPNLDKEISRKKGNSSLSLDVTALMRRQQSRQVDPITLTLQVSPRNIFRRGLGVNKIPAKRHRTRGVFIE